MRVFVSEPSLPRAVDARPRAPRRLGLRSATISGPDALIVVALLLMAVRLLAVLPTAFNVDTWLALTAGRMLWHAGIPHHESLTVLARGRPWIDQQWLGQLISYALWRLGGLGLLGVSNVALLVGGLGIAVAGARRLGASVRGALVPLAVCAWLLLPATEVRTQAFAVPLFAMTVYLLARDARRPSWQVYGVLPLLVVWANVHGSASLGAALVALRGATLAWEQRRRLWRTPSVLARPLGLILGASLCLLVTPYGWQVVSYYHSTLASSAFRDTVTEWQPVTSSLLVAVPFFCLAGAMVWSFGRAPQRTTLWDRIALLVLAAMTIGVIRNVAFFALGALVLVPVSLTTPASHTIEPPTALRRRINRSAVWLSVVVTTIAVIALLVRPAAKLEPPNPKAAMLVSVESAVRADPGLRIAADTHYADWLLWRAPWLAGHITGDARFELYTAHELYAFRDLYAASGAGWKQAANGDGLLVLDQPSDHSAIVEFLREPGARAVYSDPQTIVILRSHPRGA